MAGSQLFPCEILIYFNFQIFSEEFSNEIFSGDAFSPLLIGIIAEKLQSGRPESYYAEFTSLQYGMLLCPLLSALGMDQKVYN